MREAKTAPDTVVENPVGPSGFDAGGRGPRGRAAIAAFWEPARRQSIPAPAPPAVV